MNPRRLKISLSFPFVLFLLLPLSLSLPFSLSLSLSVSQIRAHASAPFSICIASERARKIKYRLETTRRNNGHETENTVPFIPCLCALLSCSRCKTMRNACPIKHVGVRELSVQSVSFFYESPAFLPSALVGSLCTISLRVIPQ